jgi:hypothetical protein
MTPTLKDVLPTCDTQVIEGDGMFIFFSLDYAARLFLFSAHSAAAQRTTIGELYNSIMLLYMYSLLSARNDCHFQQKSMAVSNAAAKKSVW